MGKTPKKKKCLKRLFLGLQKETNGESNTKSRRAGGLSTVFQKKRGGAKYSYP